jgi:RHS repeat-associated protein
VEFASIKEYKNMEFTKMRSLFKIEDIYAKQSQDDSAQNKGIGSIYNVLGQRISIPQSNPLGIGVTASLTPAQTQSIDSLDYVGNFIYEKGVLKRYMFDDGYLKLYTNTFSPRFFIKDHLGNNRIVTDGSGNIQQNTNYYPYGGMTSISTNQGEQQFKYNGKEYDPMHGLNEYDYGARQYDPARGQFTTMDPLCEKYYHISPYAYCGGNPVNRIDVDGKDWYEYKGQYQWRYSFTPYYEDEEGNKWKNVGHTYTDKKSKKYYSLFGQRYNRDDKGVKAIELIDKAVIDYAEVEAEKAYNDKNPPSNKNYTSETIREPLSFFGDAFEFIPDNSILDDPNTHLIRYGGSTKPFRYYVVDNSDNSHAQGINVIHYMNVIDYWHNNYRGIGIRFQNEKRMDLVIGVFEPLSIAIKNYIYYRSLVSYNYKMIKK